MKRLYKPFMLALYAGALSLGVLSCSDDDSSAPAAQKVTKVTLDLKASGKGNADATVTFEDQAGVAGKTATQLLVLSDNASYTGTITVENAGTNITSSITGVDYNVSGVNGVTFSGPPTAVTATTGAASTTNGRLTMTLKENNGASQQVTFRFVVQ